jgi:cytochrome b561
VPNTHDYQPKVSTMALNTEASAALVYLILYTILFTVLLFGYVTGRLRLRSRYTVIFFHVTVRLACQSSGLAYGVVGYANSSLLVAYFVLGGKSSSLASFKGPAEHAVFQQPKGIIHS